MMNHECLLTLEDLGSKLIIQFDSETLNRYITPQEHLGLQASEPSNNGWGFFSNPDQEMTPAGDEDDDLARAIQASLA